MNDRLPFGALLENPLKSLKKAGLVVVVGIVLGLLMPAVVDIHQGTFSRDQVLLKVDAIYKEIADAVRKDDAAKKSLEVDINNIDDRLSVIDKLDGKSVMDLINARKLLEENLKNWKPRLYIAPMYPDPLITVWPLFYLAFGIMIFLLRPYVKVAFLTRGNIELFLGTWTLYRCPTWLRNLFPIDLDNRKVFAGTNYDIDPISFFTQETQALLVCLLMVSLWIIWSSYFAHWRKDLLKAFKHRKVDANSIEALSRALVRQYVHWQICSALLAVAFIPYTYFFWQYVGGISDQRYLAQAIMMQAFWGLSWGYLTLPLAFSWYKWNSIKHQHDVLTKKETSGSDEDNGDEKSTEAPLNIINVLFAGAAAAIAFLAPIAKSIFVFH